MNKKTFFKAALVALALAPAAALADEATGTGLKLLGVSISAGLAALGGAIGIGILAGRYLEGMSRQPELEGRLWGRFLITLGLTDALPFIAIAIGMLVLFVF